MSIDALLALIPVIIVASISVIVMLVVSFFRHHRFVSFITALGFVAAGVAAYGGFGEPAVQVTPLLIFDDYSRFYVVLGCFASVPGVLLAYDYLQRSEDLKEEYYILLSLAVLGAVVLAASNHFASFFIGIELLSVSLFAMVGYTVHGEHKRLSTLEASIKYMILSGVSSGFLLFGVALLYLDFGVMGFTGIYQAIVLSQVSGYGLMGAAMLVIGIGFKLSWVPFHMWTPDVYEGAPVPVTAFLATISKVIVFGIATRFFVESGIYKMDTVVWVLSVIAVLSILVGNGLALLQNNLKRLLAYSSIAHMGYLLVAFIAAASVNPANRAIALEAVSYYLVAYVVTTWVAFGALAALCEPERGHEAENLQQFRGLFWFRPWLAGVFSIALLSLAGVPLTAGFMAKFYIFASGVSQQLWLLLATLMLGSAVSLYFYLKIILEMFKGHKPLQETAAPGSTQKLNGAAVVPMENKVALVAMAALIIYLGTYPRVLVTTIQRAIGSLAGL